MSVELAVSLFARECLPDAPITVDPFDAATREQVGHFLGRDLPTYSDRVMVEGPRWRIEVAPGLVAVRSSDPARAERAAQRALDDRAARVDMRLALREAGEEDLMDQQGVSRVRSWSRKSRSRMVQRMLELDFASGFGLAELTGARLGMVTLTYPGDWLAVAPDPKSCRRHVAALRRRWERRWGPLAAVWKREFQRRGAPHYHLGCMIPSDPDFLPWLSATWAEIVGASDRCVHDDSCEECAYFTGCECPGRGGLCPGSERARHLEAGTGVDFDKGARSSDPRRFAAYFSKHGIFAAKDYQNDPPAEWPAEAGVGRFWGYWRIEPLVGAVEVAPDVARGVARAARRWADAQSARTKVHRWRTRTLTRCLDTGFPVVGVYGRDWRRVKRRTTVPIRRLRAGSGFLAVNDGPAFAGELARVASLTTRFRPVKRSGAGPVGFLP